jgi:midasin (ATPase involved in ribosome maturation)
MKAAITIPNPIYNTSRQIAKKLGISLDEFCTKALTAYVAGYKVNDITEKLDKVYKTESSSVDSVLFRIQEASLGSEKW